MKTNREKEVVRKIVREILLQENGTLDEDSGPYFEFGDENTPSVVATSTTMPKLDEKPGSMAGYAKHPLRTDSDNRLVIVSPINGVEMYKDVVLTDTITDFVRRMRANLHRSVPMTITSGVRTPEQQAAAMFQKHVSAGAGVRGGPGYQEIKNVYNQTIADLFYSGEITKEGWHRIIQKLSDEDRKSFAHIVENGVDIRTRALNDASVADLIDAAKRSGARDVFTERYPPHLHITIE